MPLDGITAKCLAGELNTRLADARLDRIQQPDRFDILLQFRANGENLRLILSANPASPRLHLTTESRDNPSEPPMFCMLLRKHLAGARLLEVSTPGYERIFTFRFTALNEMGDRLEKVLVAEIMGRHSNIILLNQDGRIHDAISHVDESVSRVREVMPARIYSLPPEQKKLAPDQLKLLLEAGEPWLAPEMAVSNLEKAILATLQGFSPQLCRELIARAGLDPRLRPAQLDDQQRRSLDQAALGLIQTVLEGRFLPSAFFDSPGAAIPIDFHSLPLQDFPWQRPMGSVSAAMDLFYLERARQNTLRQKKQALEKAISNQLEHCRKKLLIHEADIAEGENREQYRLFGELILASMHLEQPDSAFLETVNYYDDEQSLIRIPLQPELNMAQNAQRYFRLYAKARTKYENGCRLATEDRQDIAWLESLGNALAEAVEPADLAAIREEILATGLGGSQDKSTKSSGKAAEAKRASSASDRQPGKPGSKHRRLRQAAQAGQRPKNAKAPREAALPPRQYVSADGLTILVGRNNLQNDQLTLKIAQKDDIWLHVQKMPGTHVIIRANRQAVPDRTLLEAAGIAAWFSKAAAALSLKNERTTFETGLKIPVDYCPVSHVRKPPGARPGMVIYEHYQTLMVSPAEPRGLA